MRQIPRVAILGNPNCGKTAIFNLLTGLNQKVSNYPGITVEKKIAQVRIKDDVFKLEDYPGSYSMVSQSIDEKIVSDNIYKWIRQPESRPDSIIYVADINNIRRNLYFCTQLLELDIPTIILLNMNDILIDDNDFDHIKLKNELNVLNVIPFSAVTHQGVNTLKDTLIDLFNDPIKSANSKMNIGKEVLDNINPVLKSVKSVFNAKGNLGSNISLRLMCNPSHIDDISLNEPDKNKIKENVFNSMTSISDDMKPLFITLESDLRYGWIDQILMNCSFRRIKVIDRKTKSEKIDDILTHSWFGPIIFVGILYFIFQSIFTWAGMPMDFIDSLVASFGNYVYGIMPDGLLRDLLVDGIIAGIGGIVIFLPQIILLMLFMTILEDTGYMTRATFMMDKFMRSIGLHGKSILPIMSGYACAIPGIISTRTIDSWKERLITILILPLISCSARLPVYVLMIGTFIPQTYLFNFIGLQGFVMVVMYFLGTITAFILAKVFSHFLSESSNPSFIMELPSYRLPIMSSVLRQVLNKSKLFLIDAGKIIMIISIILWFLVSFPKNDLGEVNISESYAGYIGQTIEPVIQPLGFDWKIGIALITSFAAREVVVSTLSTIYNIDDDGEDMVNLKEAMLNDVNPETGQNTYTPLIAISLMVFYVYAAQCMVTFAVVKTETNGWKWPIFMVFYMTLLAYGMSFMVFQIGRMIGFI
jgi:ferrous iron transport protein B